MGYSLCLTLTTAARFSLEVLAALGLTFVSTRALLFWEVVILNFRYVIILIILFFLRGTP